MKLKLYSIILILLASITSISCSDDDYNSGQVAVTVPVLKLKSDIRNSIDILEPQATNSDGKIYVYDNLLFYIAQYSGIHIFNNQNPASPENIAFIQLEGVNDISIKNNILYADNYMDLVVFDITDISDIQLVNIAEDVLFYYATYPTEPSAFVQTNVIASDDQFIANYETIFLERAVVENNPDSYYNLESPNTFDGSDIATNIGVGGSYAKFQIYNNALYTLEDYKLNTFDISDYNNIFLASEVYMNGWFGGVLETTFIQKEYLFIGATDGMHIISIQNEFNPSYLSSFIHATGCDPVVVNGNTAYITVRGGSLCGSIEDQINVIDVSDISNPVEHSTYFLSSPYGLGVRNQSLYVCNDEGIHVFDVQNPNQIVLMNSYPANIKDVIPLDSHLIGVGENVIYQFNYVNDFELDIISETLF
jgi:hypothetical protein